MDSTGATDFRSQMKEWLDAAQNSPIKVNRPNGKSVVIIDTETYEKMVLELAELRGVVRGLSAVAQGKTLEYSQAEMKNLGNKSAEKFKAKHSKKAVG